MEGHVPRVSIITATYNYSGVLRCAIQSVLWQTFQDFEHLIIGDGCTDDSAEVVASFNDPRLCWINLPENTGNQSAPNNKGLELARGEYIAYLGHDDIWHPTHLAALVKTLDETGAHWGHSLMIAMGPPESGVRGMFGLVEPGKEIGAVRQSISANMHRRSLVDTIGGWKDYRTLDLGPDREFQRRAVASGVPLTVVENVSVFKFPAAWRKNVYRDKPTYEQEAYIRRIQTEPDFMERELFATVKALELHAWEKWQDRKRVTKTPAPGAPPGAQVELWRKYYAVCPQMR